MNNAGKLKIKTTSITATPRTLNATWVVDYESVWTPPEPKIDISTLTSDQQADLIVEKLRAPPKPKRSLQDDYAVIMAKVIAEEIDKEILQQLTKGLFE
jgi:hypothetical protein